MGNFAAWRAAADKREVRRVTWVCGDQLVLVEEVVDTIRALLAPSELDALTLHAGSVPDADIWAAAHQYPALPGATRLIVVRNAEAVAHWAPLPGWLAATRRLPGVYLLFVSGAPDLPYRDGKRGPLAPHVDAMKAPRGHVVRATMPSESDAIAWTRRRANLDDDLARHLLTRTGGDLAQVAAVCAKLALFDAPAGRHTIDALCAEAPASSFVDSLLFGHKRAALRAAAGLDEREYAALIGQLDHRLDLLAVLWRAARTGATREVATLPAFLVKRYTPAAHRYDPKRCAYARRLLAVVDDAIISGARDAVLEALVAIW